MSRRHSSSRKRTSSRRKEKPRIPTYSSLTEREKGTYRRALNFFSDLRGRKGSYSALLREHHLDGRTVRKYLGRNLLGGTRGQPVRASKADRMVRDLLFPMPSGDVPIRTRSSRDATKLSDYYNDREKLLRGKLSVAKFETKWRGVRIAGKEVFADAGTILEMADADVLKMENLYASVGGEQ
jgi:hypothetical protein